MASIEERLAALEKKVAALEANNKLDESLLEKKEVDTTHPAAAAADTVLAPMVVRANVPHYNYKEKEDYLWNYMPLLLSSVVSKNMSTLKLSVHAHAFYSVVRDGKCLEFRAGDWIYNMLTKNVYDNVVLYHGYYKAHERPFVVKKFMGVVVAENGVNISYPLMDVTTSGVTFCIRLGDTLEYFNPHSVEQQNKFLNNRLNFIIQDDAKLTPTKSQIDYVCRRISDKEKVSKKSVGVLEQACVDGSPVKTYAQSKLTDAYKTRTGEELQVDEVLAKLKLVD